MRRAGDGDPRHPDLTVRQRDIVCFCTEHIERNGYPPTLREIGAAVGLKTPSSVSYQIKQLQKRGYLCHDPGPAPHDHAAPPEKSGRAPGLA